MIKTVSKNKNGLKGSITIPSDKSLSHRAVMFSALANGTSTIKNFSKGQDCLSTLSVFEQLGVKYEFQDENTLLITSDGKLRAPKEDLYCGNSGTTMRLMSGILAGQDFDSTLTGDESLSKRPMARVIDPLKLMGADISAKDNRAPLHIKGKKLQSIDYVSKLSSAQVKSCILLAGLHAQGITTFTEPHISRDHTERMLQYLGADIVCDNNKTTIKKSELKPMVIEVAGDISSAAFFVAAALIVPNSDIILKNVGLNQTRTGVLDVVKMMGGDLEILDKKLVSNEEIGDIRIKTSTLKACEISGDLIPRLIDELPVIAVLATQAQGSTIVKDAQDLRNKESDRIAAVVTELKKIGANITETKDGFVIHGKTSLKGDAVVETYHDHRLAMSLYVAGLVCENPIKISGFEWVNISFPTFEELFQTL